MKKHPFDLENAPLELPEKSRNLKELEFEAVNSFTNHGNGIDICRTNYKGVNITETRFSPWNFLKKASYSYLVDLVIPEKSDLEKRIVDLGGVWADWYYTDEGFGLPQFDELDKAIAYIDWFKELKQYNPQ